MTFDSFYWNFITLTKPMIFQRGRYTTNQTTYWWLVVSLWIVFSKTSVLGDFIFVCPYVRSRSENDNHVFLIHDFKERNPYVELVHLGRGFAAAHMWSKQSQEWETDGQGLCKSGDATWFELRVHPSWGGQSSQECSL